MKKIEDKDLKKTTKQQAKGKKAEGKGQQKIAKDEAKVKAAKGTKSTKDDKKALKALEKDQAKLAKGKSDNQKALAKIQTGETKSLGKNEQKLTNAMDKAHDRQFDVNGVAKKHPTALQKFAKAMGIIAPIGIGTAGAIGGMLEPELAPAITAGTTAIGQGVNEGFNFAAAGNQGTMKAETAEQAQAAMDHRGRDMTEYEALAQKASASGRERSGAKRKRGLGLALERRELDAELRRAWARLVVRQALRS